MIAACDSEGRMWNKTPVFLPVAGEIEEATQSTKIAQFSWQQILTAHSFDFVARQKIHGQTLNLVYPRTTPRHRPLRLRPPLRRHHRPRPRSRPRPPPHLHRPRHGPLRPRPRLRWPALHLERRSSAATCAPASTPSTSTSTASPAQTPPTSSTPSPSSAATTKPPSAHYRTKEMILAYYNALNAGDTDTDVAL